MCGPLSEYEGVPEFDGAVDSPELAELRAQIDRVGRGVLRRIDPGTRAMVIAVGVLVVVVAGILPWVDGVSGWQVLFGQRPVGDTNKADLLVQVFSIGVFVFGLLGSSVALITRLWLVCYGCTLGCGLFTVLGMVSIWTQQTTASHQPGPGPGIGLILAVLTMLVLVVTWARLVWSRPGGLFAHRTD
jgi:hypothetical protein